MPHPFKKSGNIRARKTGGFVVVVLSLLFAAIALAIVLGAGTPIISHYYSAQGFIFSKQAYAAANSAADEALYRLKNGKTMPSSLTIDLSTGSSTIAVSSTPNGKKAVITGATSTYQRDLEINLNAGAGVAFNYGLQAGAGGMTLSGGSTINGNAYANGSILGSSATITGTAVAAGPASTLGGGTYVGAMAIGSGGVGDAWAATVTGVSAAGTIYCTNTGASKKDNESCDASKGTPPILDMPFTADNLADWENAAAAGGTVSAVTVGWQGATLGPVKVNGDLTVDGGGTLILTGPLWVTGNVTVTSGGKVALPSDYGKNSEVIIANGTITVNGGGSVGSGTSGSYLFFVSTSTCMYQACSGNSAINISGGAGAIAANAQSGDIDLKGGAALEAATGYSIHATGGTTITYDSGLASPVFQSGPSGGYGLDSWFEY